MEPNYEEYTLEELYDVYQNIDRENHPERFKKICEQLALKESLEKNKESKEHEKSSDYPVRKTDIDGNYIPNSISVTDRLCNFLLALAFIIYGSYGVYKNQLYVPSRRGDGIYLSGESAWIMYSALICGFLYFLTIVIDHYDKRDNEIKYFMFGKNVKLIGMILAGIAVFYPIFQS